VGRDRPLLVERAADADSPAIEGVSVDHRGADVAVTQELLDRADVGSKLEKVHRDSVPERVRRGLLRNAGHLHSAPEGALQRLFEHMVAAYGTRARIAR